MAEETSPAQLTPAEAAAFEKLERESWLPAKGNLLYLLHCLLTGTPVDQAPGAVFSLSNFIHNGQLPTREQRGWLISMERKLHTLPQFTHLLTPDESITASPENRNEDTPEAPPQDPDALVMPKEKPRPQPTSGIAAVHISADGMQAWLFLLPPTGGGPALTPEQLLPFLAEQQVHFGIDEAAIQDACSQNRYLTLVQVAAGVPPVHGEDGYIIDHFKREPEINYALREDGTMDYRDLGWLQTAREGQLICEAVPPTPPVAGTTVRGTEMPGRPGKSLLPPGGGGTRLSEDKLQLLAALDGVVGFAFQRFTVVPLLIIQGDVDSTVGNLQVRGDVVIHGDVREGFKVQATGNITVQGMVEAAQLTAGKDIRVGLGINGNSIGVITAGKDVYSKFLENTTVTAGGSVISDAIIGSAITCDDSLYVDTGKGALIGGSVTVQNRIQANVIGTSNGRHIELVLGSPHDYLEEQAELEEKLERLQAELDAKQKDLEFLTEGPGAKSGNPGYTGTLRSSILLYKRRVVAAQRSLEQLLAARQDFSHCRLLAGTLYSPANVSIGPATLPVRQTIQDVEMYFADNIVALKSR